MPEQTCSPSPTAADLNPMRRSWPCGPWPPENSDRVELALGEIAGPLVKLAGDHLDRG